MNSICLLGLRLSYVSSIVKEGGFRQLSQVTFNVFIGSIISNVVCFSLWPQYATLNLQRDITTSLESYATLLDMLVRTFLLDPQSRHGMGKTRLQRAVEAHQKSFTSLKTNLDEARSEWVLNPPDPFLKERRVVQRKQISELYGEAVDSLTRLGQHLAGLRGGTRLQIELSAAYRAGRIMLPKRKTSKDISQENYADNSQAGSPPAEDRDKGRVFASVEDEENAMLVAAAQIFGDLVDDVGPPMTALTVRFLLPPARSFSHPTCPDLMHLNSQEDTQCLPAIAQPSILDRGR